MCLVIPSLNRTNGELSCQPLCSKMRHRSTLVQQERPTGVSPQDGSNQLSSHSIIITTNKKSVVMPYGLDPDTDMFQV